MKRQLTAIGLSTAFLLPLAACGTGGALAGFTPMYGSSGPTAPRLSRIEVANVSGRTAYLMREALDDEFARNRSEAPLYRLVMSVKEIRIPRGLRTDNVANRYELQVNVTYALVDIADRKSVTRGQVSSLVSYDAADQPFAAVAAHQDAQERAAEEAAQRLRLRLAAYFSNPEAYSVEAAKARQMRLQERQTGTVSDRLAPQDVDAPADKAEETEDLELQEALDPAVGTRLSSDAPLQLPAAQ